MGGSPGSDGRVAFRGLWIPRPLLLRSGALCPGVHQDEDSRPLLDRPLSRRARPEASHPQLAPAAGLAHQASSPLCEWGGRVGPHGGFCTWPGGGEWSGALEDLYLPSHCQIQKRHSSGSMDDRPSLSAREYVESLHQNSRATLLYGKNNVLVQPVRVHFGPRSSTGGLGPGYGGGVP